MGFRYLCFDVGPVAIIYTRHNLLFEKMMMQKLRNLPIFKPIPREHYQHVKSLLCAEFYWNTKIAIIGVITAILLYYYLLTLETTFSHHAFWFTLQAAAALPITLYIFFGETWFRSIRVRIAILSTQAFIIASLLGLGFLYQTPMITNTYNIATIYSLIVGVTGAASFTFTISPNTFLLFAIPFIGPMFYWLWFQSPNGSGRVLAWLEVPYLGVLYFLILREYRRRVNLILTELQLKLEQEKLVAEEQLSRKLLLNILPMDVASELKNTGRAEPVEYSNVTVMFTDFVGFTKISETMSPKELIDELDKCFSYFDQVTEKYKLEKLKTIGDSFMCAGGIPRSNLTNSIDCALAALEIRDFMNQMKSLRESQGLPYWELRIGIHSGPIVAGVVGTHKFAYDIWGDTVNTASRMESGGASGKINLSKAVYDQLRFMFECEFRGKIAAKNKGEIDMYFLNGIRRKFSLDENGRVPNDNFRTIYAKISLGARLIPRRADGAT